MMATMTKRSGKRRRHLPHEDLAAFLEGRLSPQKKEQVIAHLAECSDCRQLVAGTTMSHKFVSDPDKPSK